MSPRIVVVAALIAGIAIALHWPALHAGLAADDFLQRGMLDGSYPVQRSPLDLYSFLRKPGELPALMDAGIAPWWSHPDLRLSLLRPLASALLALDVSVLGLTPVGQHVHSFVWLAAFVICFYALARKTVGPGAAVLATAMMAFDPALVAPVAWVCNRTALVSATFGALALLAYFRFREDGSSRARWLSALGFTLALAGGEYAFCAVAYVVAYELLRRREPPKERALAALSALVPAALYLALHVALSYGADGSVVYVGPLDSPRQFLEGALLRIPALVATGLLLTPGERFYASLLARDPTAYAALVPVVVAAALLVLVLRRSDATRRRMLLTLAIGSLLGLLPLAGTVPSVRLILIPSMGQSAVLGALVWDAGARLAKSADRRRMASWLVAIATLPFAVVHLAFAPKYTHVNSSLWAQIVTGIRHIHLDADIDDTKVSGQEVVLINAGGDIAALIYPRWVRHYLGGAPMPRRWRALTSSLRPEQITRVSSDTLELSVQQGTLFEDPTSQMFRAPTLAFHPGDTAEVPGLHVTVIEVKGWAPTRVRFRFDSSLDDPNRVFLIQEAGRMRRAFMPPVGGEFVVPAHG